MSTFVDPQLDLIVRSARMRIGQVVDSKYRLVSVLGVGGMGIVYEAEHQFLGRIVALKILHPRYVDKLDEFRRFMREVRAVGAVGHKAIVEVYDAGSLDGTTPYFVMERLIGENLEQMIKRKGRLSVDRTFRIAKEVLKGLDAAHAKGIVHCDMKPANVFLVRSTSRSGSVKLLDFGISRMMGDLPNPSDLAADQVFGTPHYMAPEQAMGEKVDARTDLYSVGAMIYESLCGTPPFLGDSLLEVFARILKEKAPDISAIRPELPKELGELIGSMLEKNPEDRPQRAVAVLAIIRKYKIN